MGRRSILRLFDPRQLRKSLRRRLPLSIFRNVTKHYPPIPFGGWVRGRPANPGPASAYFRLAAR